MTSQSTRSAHSTHANRFELWFRSLFNQGCGFAFPCDAEGRVNCGQEPRTSIDPPG